MKKYLLAALVVLSASTFAANVTVYGGLNLNGDVKILDSKEDTELGSTIGVEAHKSVAKLGNGNLEVGLGTKYDSTITNEEDGKEYKYASSMPIYGSVKYNYKVNKNISLYIQGKAGYAFMFEDETVDITNDDLASNHLDAKFEIEGKMYTGIAIGAEMGNYTVGLSYDITEADMKLNGSDAEAIAEAMEMNVKTDVEYKKLALTVGYKFGK
jgi:hypothetical protein